MSVDLLADFFNPPAISIIPPRRFHRFKFIVFNGGHFYRPFFIGTIHLILSNKNLLVKYRSPSLIL